MRFIVCNEPAQIREAQRLRFEVYCVEKSWVDPGACENGVEADPSDPHAVHFLALDGDMPVGTARGLLGWRQDLPAAACLDLAPLGLAPNEVAEVSRLATRRDMRSHDQRIFLGLTAVMWRWGMANSIKVWLAIADVPLYHMLTRAKLPVLMEGKPIDYLGSLCVPMAFDMAKTGPALQKLYRPSILSRETRPLEMPTAVKACDTTADNL